MNSSAAYEELVFFQEHDQNVLQEFVEIAFEYLTSCKGKHKSYSSAAVQLNCETSVIQKLIEALADILLENVRVGREKSDFLNLISPILIEDSKINVLWDFITLRHDLISKLLSNAKINQVKFSALNWRLQHTIASKSLGSCQDTNFLLEIETNGGDGKFKRYLSADIPNLVHMTEVLESALNEIKSTHVRKIMNSHT